MTAILKTRDKNGNWIPIPSIKGEEGKSAYEQAVEGGFSGSEDEFKAILNGLAVDSDHINNKENPHEVTPEQIGAARTDLTNGEITETDEIQKDIRSFISNYPSGHYTANNIQCWAWCLPGNNESFQLDWFRCESPENGKCGTLIARPMDRNMTYICGIYDETNFTDWQFITDRALPIAGGLMEGVLIAQADTTPETSKVRNSALVSTETTPTNNGDICWIYE